MNQTIKQNTGILVYLIVFNTAARFYFQLLVITGYIITTLHDSFSWLEGLQWGGTFLLSRLQNHAQTYYIM